MKERVKQILESIEEIDPVAAKKILNAVGKNEPVEVEYKLKYVSNGFNMQEVYTTVCPDCGEILEFQPYTFFAFPYAFCSHCGKKLIKKD